MLRLESSLCNANSFVMSSRHGRRSMGTKPVAQAQRISLNTNDGPGGHHLGPDSASKPASKFAHPSSATRIPRPGSSHRASRPGGGGGGAGAGMRGRSSSSSGQASDLSLI